MPSKHLRISFAFAVVVALVVLSALLPGCRSPRAEVFKPKGELVASVRITDTAFKRVPKGDCGFFLYLEDLPIYPAQRLLVYYKVRDGRIESSGAFGSTESQELVKSLDAIGLEPFDCAKEVEESRVKKEAADKARGDDTVTLSPFDGAEYEITIKTKKGLFVYRAWNPGFDIDFYASYSPKIAKLKAYIDTLARAMGRNELEL
jgi:hypothetical protein